MLLAVPFCLWVAMQRRSLDGAAIAFLAAYAALLILLNAAGGPATADYVTAVLYLNLVVAVCPIGPRGQPRPSRCAGCRRGAQGPPRGSGRSAHGAIERDDRAGAGRRRGQDPLPCHRVARGAHAAQRRDRHGDCSARRRARPERPAQRRGDPQLRPPPARGDQPHPRLFPARPDRRAPGRHHHLRCGRTGR